MPSRSNIEARVKQSTAYQTTASTSHTSESTSSSPSRSAETAEQTSTAETDASWLGSNRSRASIDSPITMDASAAPLRAHKRVGSKRPFGSESAETTDSQSLAPLKLNGEESQSVQNGEVHISELNGSADDVIRRERIERVLKRARVGKMNRAFQQRLALAAFKTRHGWQNANLDQMENFLEQQQIRQQNERLQQQQQPQYPQYPHYPIQPHYAPPQHAMHPSQAGYGQGSPALQHFHHQHQNSYNSPMPAHQAYHGPRQGSMGPPAMTSFNGKRSRAPSLVHAGNNLYEPLNYSPANGQFLPVASTSALGPAVQLGANSPHVQQQQHSLPPTGTPHLQKRRSTNPISMVRPNSAQLSSTPTSRPMAVTGSAPHTLPSIVRHRHQNSLTSSDPNFSSFVDAASVLSGLAKKSSNSSQGENDAEMEEGAAKPTHENVGEEISRPHTPPTVGFDRLRAGDRSAEGAAELMLFLAHSPSPVQIKNPTSRLPLAEDGMMKGRRLFSNTNSDTNSADSNPFAEFSAAAAASAGNSHPEKPTSYSNSTLGFGMNGPTTPGRDRQASFGVNGWESYLNVSPSPKREARTEDRTREMIGRELGFGLPLSTGTTAFD